MKKLLLVLAAVVLLGTSAAANSYVWNFSNTSDYYAAGSAVVNTGSAHVSAIADDEASVFAKINTQAVHLKVGQITGGGFTVTSLNNPTGTIYGSLYLSPTGGSGSTVLINLSPMTVAGTGTLNYSFDLNTKASVLTLDRSDPDADWVYQQQNTTFAGAISWINASAYSGAYSAFFGPQIGMSGTHNTTFNVTQISLNTVPEPSSIVALLGGLVSLLGLRRRRA